MEGALLKEGKARVRRCLIDPLIQKGMIRKRSQKVEDHEKMLGRLEARLAYMLESQLKTLADVVERRAEGPKKNTWPTEISIFNLAVLLQNPPVEQSRLVRSYLQSRAGLSAKSGGYLVELFCHLKKFGVPPNSFSLKRINQRADDNRRKLTNIQQKQEQGHADAHDIVWAEGYMAELQVCLDIINSKSKGQRHEQ